MHPLAPWLTHGSMTQLNESGGERVKTGRNTEDKIEGERTGMIKKATQEVGEGHQQLPLARGPQQHPQLALVQVANYTGHLESPLALSATCNGT